MDNRLSQQKHLLVPTRELPVRSTFHSQNRLRGFHETIGIAARRNCSPAPIDSEDEGTTSVPSSQASVPGEVAAAPTKRPRGRPPKKQTKANEGSVKRPMSQGPPPAKKRRGRQPKAKQPPSRSRSVPPLAHVSRHLRSYVETPTTTAANKMDSSVVEGEGDADNLDGREVELAMLEKIFQHNWSKYYASIDKISGDQVDSALKIFFERVLTPDEES